VNVVVVDSDECLSHSSSVCVPHECLFCIHVSL
jgi:hypothetical protein